jgi:hypothetical protein
METAGVPIAVLNFTAGTLCGWTFNAGSTAAITAYADYSGTVAGTVLATSTHGLATGDIIGIRGTTNYNGIFQITVVDATHFYFTDTWVADDGASDFDEASYLEYAGGVTRTFLLRWDGTAVKAAGSGATVNYVWYKNTTAQAQTTARRDYPASDNGSNGGGGIIANVANGDRIFLTMNSDQTDNMTNVYGNVTVIEM